ncbi:MAG: nuclear transport factor 2 family protein [Chloroflexota bacterium]
MNGHYADEVTVDYTSMVGGEPATIPADALIESWQGLLPGFTATQHLIGSHVVEIQGNTAECQSHFQAIHTIDDGQWILGGHDHHQLQRSGDEWRITAITMTALWSTGDGERLRSLAAERVTQSVED